MVLSSGPAPDDKAAKKTKEKEEPLTNEKIWDRVLANHPEQDDIKNSDVLYEYSRKARQQPRSVCRAVLTSNVSAP